MEFEKFFIEGVFDFSFIKSKLGIRNWTKRFYDNAPFANFYRMNCVETVIFFFPGKNRADRAPGERDHHGFVFGVGGKIEAGKHKRKKVTSGK